MTLKVNIRMKDTRKEQLKNEMKNLQTIQSAIKKIVEDEELDPSDANEQLEELNGKLQTVIDNLGKI